MRSSPTAAPHPVWWRAPLAAVDARALQFFRRWYCIALAAITTRQLLMMEHRYTALAGVYAPVSWLKPLGLPPAALVVAVGLCLVVSLAIAAMGPQRVERASLVASLALCLLFYGTVLGWHQVYPGADQPSPHHSLHPFVLLVLAVASGSRAAWPLWAVKALLAVAYFGAAYTKLHTSGLRWLNGFNLQTIFLERVALMPSLTLAESLAQNHVACLLLSWATVAFELLFFTVLLWPHRHKALRLYAVGGLMFHLGTWVLMGISDFLLSFCAAYLVFLEWPRREGAPSSLAIESPGPRRLTAAVLALLLLCVVARVHYWPLGDFETYSSYQDYRDQVDIVACEHLERDGSTKPCFGEKGAGIALQVLVRMEPREEPSRAARRWVSGHLAAVPPERRRALIGRALRLTLRYFPVQEGRITVRREVVTIGI